MPMTRRFLHGSPLSRVIDAWSRHASTVFGTIGLRADRLGPLPHLLAARAIKIRTQPSRAKLMIATLIGGTGLTGSFLVRQLLADPAIMKVISVSRKSLNIKDAKLTELLLTELAELPSIESQIRGELYFCCLGTTIKAAGSKENFEKIDHATIVAFAEIAKRHDAKSFTLVSSVGANASSMFFYNQIKGRTEDDIKALGLRSLIILRPALLVGPRHEFRLSESIVAKTLVPFAQILPVRARKSLITEAETLATRMLVEGKAAREGAHVIQAKDI
jgi:hypothetical protein